MLLGNSIGGAVSIRYVSLHPERVKAIVLYDCGGLGPPGPVGRVFIGGFVQFFAAGGRGAFWFPWPFACYCRKVLLKRAAQEQRERIIRSAYEIAATLEQAWRSFNRPEENLAPLLPQIRCPVLLAWAKDDFMVAPETQGPFLSGICQSPPGGLRGRTCCLSGRLGPLEQVLRGFLNQVCGV